MPNSGMNQAGPSNDDYETPDWLFKALDTEFGFTLDGAANEGNAKCKEYISKQTEHDKFYGVHRVYVNPPYSEIETFINTALTWSPSASIIVMLLPVRTDTQWFQMLQESPRVEIRWLRRRIRFELEGKQVEGSPRFASMIAIVRPR